MPIEKGLYAAPMGLESEPEEQRYYRRRKEGYY